MNCPGSSTDIGNRRGRTVRALVSDSRSRRDSSRHTVEGSGSKARRVAAPTSRSLCQWPEEFKLASSGMQDPEAAVNHDASPVEDVVNFVHFECEPLVV